MRRHTVVGPAETYRSATRITGGLRVGNLRGAGRSGNDEGAIETRVRESLKVDGVADEQFVNRAGGQRNCVGDTGDVGNLNQFMPKAEHRGSTNRPRLRGNAHKVIVASVWLGQPCAFLVHYVCRKRRHETQVGAWRNSRAFRRKRCDCACLDDDVPCPVGVRAGAVTQEKLPWAGQGTSHDQLVNQAPIGSSESVQTCLYASSTCSGAGGCRQGCACNRRGNRSVHASLWQGGIGLRERGNRREQHGEYDEFFHWIITRCLTAVAAVAVFFIEAAFETKLLLEVHVIGTL